ncbi:hypothetical protein JKX24_05450 [Serratia proteamaculans]|uniref:Uncharacterized protein n=1 Tax=Serratia proteamaculans TaxID=28151 RepID=A0A7U0N923_SERPR|nr:DUF5677 domain-containing protein [Serratia proteamaculans]MBO1501457.1 hypothetical protein [Serratia proteamaculans]MDW5509461.1 DUF5677 domain-containing protein [Serratia proteamaculans]QQX54459.1 hypothetical protein JKX24_05450 [Serratia proteamaculans]
MSYDADLSKLMNLCFLLIESKNGEQLLSGCEWKNDAQVLSVKIFRHIATAQQISAGIYFEFCVGQVFSHIDHSSVAVVVRAAIESYLAFNYIFVNQDESLSIYRYKLWRRAGLIDRSKLLANTSESKNILSQEAESIKELYNDIARDPHYQKSNREGKKEIEKGNWKPKGGWHAIINKTDIHQRYFSDVYNHLSGHSHTSFISALQIRDATSIEQQAMLAGATRQILCMVISHFIFSYVKLFPAAKAVMASNPELTEIADRWHIHKKEVAAIYGPVQ